MSDCIKLCQILLDYITLYYIILHYITLYYIRLHYILLHYIRLHDMILHYNCFRIVLYLYYNCIIAELFFRARAWAHVPLVIIIRIPRIISRMLIIPRIISRMLIILRSARRLRPPKPILAMWCQSWSHGQQYVYCASSLEA